MLLTHGRRRSHAKAMYSFGTIRKTVTTEHDMNLLPQFLDDNHLCEKSKNDNRDDCR